MGDFHDRTGSGDTLLWAGAGAIVLAAHLGIAAWLMSSPPLMAADNEPPAAIMIELAPEPEAVLTEETDISPEQQTAEASRPVEQVEAPDEPVPETPVEETPEIEPTPEEPVEEPPPVLENVEVPLPVVRPKPPEEKREIEKPEKPREKPVRQRQAPSNASQAAIEAQAQVRASTRTAAAQTASGRFSNISPANWQSKLMAHLERRKRYPAGAKSRGERGIVYVRFQIDDAGNVLSAALARSSGFAELDREVVALVRRASPVPPPPVGMNKTITAPVRFSAK